MRFSRVIVSGLVLALLAAAGALWWICTRSDAIAFLPARGGAEWIVYPKQAESRIHDTLPITAHFRQSFMLPALPASATLTVRAFKDAAVAINGQEVADIPKPGRSWKTPSSAEVAVLLQPGTNEITARVTNSGGPPALWLRLQSDRFSLGTSERWQVSLGGTGWQSARRATQPLDFQPGGSLDGSMSLADVLKRVWPVEAGFGAVSLALVWGANYWLRRKRSPANALPTTTSTGLSYGLLVIVLLARTALFINNLPQLPRSMGFDADEHEHYIRFIQEKHALPLANDGYQMYQPPLYYLASTLVLGGCGRSVGDEDAVYFLRSVNGVIGLLHCWLVLVCLRLLFPENFPAQAAGLLVASFLPPTLYLSQYVTNEPLAGFLVTVAIYLCLRELRAEKGGLWLPIGIGAALGGAMLTKFSVLLALPCFFVALGRRVVSGKQHACRDWLRSVGLITAGFLLVCGWHYGRVWARFGTPIVGNWDSQAELAWWQEPGLHTSGFYTSFGRGLSSPMFSAFNSFADGVYSTLWGDGLASGVADPNFVPPWNYDLMGAGYWASLGICLVLILGAALAVAKIIYQSRAEWLLMLGMVCIFGFGLLWMTLRVPIYSNVKAFYALPALLPLSALAAIGWDWLRQRHRTAGAAAWVVLLIWSMTVYASFWVRSANPRTHLVRGMYLAGEGHYPEAVKSFSIALQLKPGLPEACNELGAALFHEGELDEAITQFAAALQARPGYAEAHYNLGVALLGKGRVQDANKQFAETLRIKPDDDDARKALRTAEGMQGIPGAAESQPKN